MAYLANYRVIKGAITPNRGTVYFVTDLGVKQMEIIKFALKYDLKSSIEP